MLYDIRAGRYYDMATFIKKEIRGYGRLIGSSMVFLCLITDMCVVARIVVDDDARDEMTEPNRPLTLATWNTQASIRGLPTIGDFPACKRHRAGEDDYEDEPLDDADQQILDKQTQRDSGAGSS